MINMLTLKDEVVKLRNSISRGIYGFILKPAFFKRDPEAVHDQMIALGSSLGKYSISKVGTKILFGYSNEKLRQKILGITFENPIGLSAGFDKNAELLDIMPNVGFGFEEVGSITGYPCEGNEKPRLWRLPESKGIVVNYGLKNDGCEAISERLKNRKHPGVFGTNIAMTNCKDNLTIHTAIFDYAKAFTSFADIGDYFTLNVSCPNAEGGQPFAIPYRLDYLLDIIDEIPTKKPIFIKLSPDLSFKEADELLVVIKKHRIHGIITTNLTKKRGNQRIIDANIPSKGGISGKPVQELSDKLLSHIYKKEKNRFVLIGTGGVFSAADAYKKIRLGASLVQMVTGMIFEGPQVVSEINRGLSELLERDGFKNVSEAVGVDAW